MIYELELNRGDDIKSSIEKFIIDKGWNFAYISGGIGSVQNIDLSNPVSNQLPPEIEITKLEGPCEVLTFTGEIMKKEYMNEDLKKVYKDNGGDLFIHIHMSCAGKGAIVYGGGMHSAKVFRGMKIYLQEMNI